MPRTNPTGDARSTTDRRVPPAARSATAVLPASAELLRSQNHVLELVARGAPLQETLDVFLRSIEGQSPGMLSSILLLDEDGLGEAIGPQAGSCGTAVYRGEAVVVEDIATDALDETLAFLQKPFTPNDLGRKVRDVLDHPLPTASGVDPSRITPD